MQELKLVKSGKIVCIGQAVMDIVVGQVRQNAFHHETMRVQYVKHLPGGHAVNHAIALSKLIKDVVFIGRVGADDYGRSILCRMKDCHIDISGVMVDPLLPTSVSVIIVDIAGEKTILQHQTGNNAFTYDMINHKLLNDASIVCVGSLWALPGLDGDGVAELFSQARTHGVITVADTGEDSQYVGIRPIIQALEYTDYFLPSNREAKAITGLDDLEKAAEALLEMGPKAVILRLGADGCLVATKQAKQRIPTLIVSPTDTTGACDNFMAGFLTKLAEGKSLIECAKFANAAGALSTLSIGANTADYDYALVESKAALL